MSDSGAMSEQETCRTFVVPGLKAAGWERDQIREQYGITAGKLVASARGHRMGDRLVADYVLEYSDDLPLAVVEAKRTKVKVLTESHKRRGTPSDSNSPWRTPLTGTRFGRS